MKILLIYLTFFNILFMISHSSFAKKLNVYDFPDKLRKKQKKKIPITGGLLILLNYLLVLFVNYFHELNFFSHLNLTIIDWYISFVIIPVLFYLLGLYDDKFDLRPAIKILLSLILFYVVINLDNNFLLNQIIISSLNLNISISKYSIFITLLCFLLFQHAFNMYDGINLHIGLYIIIFLSFLFFITGINFFIIFTLPFLFFLFLNFRNRSYMGDGGCYFVSYILSIYCVYFYNLGKLNTEQIFLLMMLPGIDMMRLFIHRIYVGKSPFSPDREHLHHYLTLKFSNFLSNLISMSLVVMPMIIYIFSESFVNILIVSIVFYLFFLYLITKQS